MITEAGIAYELYHRIRTQYPDLTVRPEHRIKKPRGGGSIRADIYIPILRLIIEVKRCKSGLDSREQEQLKQYQALTQLRNYTFLYCKGMGDIPPVLVRIEDMLSTIIDSDEGTRSNK